MQIYWVCLKISTESLDESKRQFHIAFLVVVLTLYIFLVLTFGADIFS